MKKKFSISPKIWESTKAPVMILKVKYQGEEVTVNLLKELKISRSGLSQDLMSQPSSYAFIGLIHKELLNLSQKAELQAKRVYAKTYIAMGKKTNPKTGRPYSNDLAKELTIINKEVMGADDRVLRLRSQVQKVEVALRAFEQKKDIMQTLSANLRKEREI